MKTTTNLRVNGKTVTVSTDPERPLLDVLREDLGLTGTKYGCGEGECGACTVLVGDAAVRSCITAVSQVEGEEIQTIEGLARDGELHPVQKAFVSAQAMQCGYCIPGQIMTAVALLRRNPRPSFDEIVDVMSGNVCRCCHYLRIRDAVLLAAQGGSTHAK